MNTQLPHKLSLTWEGRPPPSVQVKLNRQLPHKLTQPPPQNRPMRKTKALPILDNGYRDYPPSFLIVTDGFHHTGKLAKELENNGCQIYWGDTSPANLSQVCHKYFDAIVLDLDQTGQHCQEVLQTLNACPGLVNIPMVILTTPKSDEDTTKIFSRILIYDLVRDNAIAATLWQIVSQIHYLTYRYLPILTC